MQKMVAWTQMSMELMRNRRILDMSAGGATRFVEGIDMGCDLREK